MKLKSKQNISLAFIILFSFLGFSLIAISAKNGAKDGNLRGLFFREKDVDICYFIQISETTLTFLSRLLQRLWHPSNSYVIHFDLKISKKVTSEIIDTLYQENPDYHKNVKIMESEVVTYRGVSMILNILSALQVAMDFSQRWTYFINISGSDYPLVSAENQRKLLSTHDFVRRNRSFFTFSERSWWKESRDIRYQKLFIDTSLSFNESMSDVVDSTVENPLMEINNFTYVAAETWMILHRSFVNFLLKSPTSRRMLLSFSYSLEPEEHYFPSLARHVPKFKDSNVPHALRHVMWVHKGNHSGQHPFYLDTYERGTKKWKFLKEIEESGCFFARKFRSNNSPLMDYIDQNLNGLGASPNVSAVNLFIERVKDGLNCVANMGSEENGLDCYAYWK